MELNEYLTHWLWKPWKNKRRFSTVPTALLLPI